MDLKTYEDTFESIIADTEIKLAKKDDRILELENELQDALNRIADKEMKNRIRRAKEAEKVNQKETKTRFTKLYPIGVEMLAMLKQEGKLNHADIGKLTLIMPQLEKDTGYLVDKSGKYMNKKQLSEMAKDSRSNFNASFNKLKDCGIIIEEDLDGKTVFRCSDSVAYNGINRVNQH